jgi:hypothetical protein
VGERETLDLVARDHRTGSVLLLSAIDPTVPTFTLEGSAVLRPEWGASETLQVPVSAVITEDDADGGIRKVGGQLVAVDAQGQTVGPSFESYEITSNLGGRYEQHSAVVVDGDDGADVFAISDPVEIALAAMGLTACLAMYSGQVWLVKTTLNQYQAQGLVGTWRMSGGFWKAVTCRFDVEITAVNPRTGQVVARETVPFGRRRK